MSTRTVLLFLGLLSSGLMAGLFFAWVFTVIPGLAKVDDPTYVSTMQNINREIINPVFVGTFMLTPMVLAAASFVQFPAGNSRRGWWLAMAAATYVVGVVGVTFGGNIPLNDELEAFDLSDAAEQALRDRRTSFETSWNRWHNLRTAASVIAFGLASVAALVEAGEE